MTVKRILPIAFGLAMFAVAGVQGYAFMMANSEDTVAEAQIDVVSMIDGLQADFQAADLEAAEMLSKIDSALEQVDTALDAGVQDETSLLVARDALVDMRLDVPAEVKGDHLASSTCNCPQCRAARAGSRSGGIGGGLIGGIGGGGIVGGGGGLVGGGGGLIGGGAGGGLLAGSNMGLLAAGAAAAVVIPTAVSDDDDPGAAASAN